MGVEFGIPAGDGAHQAVGQAVAQQVDEMGLHRDLRGADLDAQRPRGRIEIGGAEDDARGGVGVAGAEGADEMLGGEDRRPDHRPAPAGARAVAAAVVVVAVVGGDPEQRRRLQRRQAIGTTLAEAAGPVAEYVLRGDELYVRAVITSSRDCADPVWPGQKRQAWTQPVGWSLDR